MELSEWIASRERTALKRVRTVGLGLAGVLLALTVWIGWREARLALLHEQTEKALRDEKKYDAQLRLKGLSLAIYLAKVREGCLLLDITGRFDLSAPCIQLNFLRDLDATSPCAALWKNALTRIWTAAYPVDAPPIPAEMATDPWGAHYLLDQSEASCGQYGEWCPHDVVSSAGPDGKADTDDDIRETIPQFLGPSRVKPNDPSASQ